MRAAPLAALACALAGCTDVDFTPRWKVDRFRLLAVVADPPDARAGEAVTLTAFTADRAGSEREASLAWVACARASIDNGTGARGCADPGASVVTDNPARFTLATAPDDGAPWTVFGLACADGAPSIDPATMQPRCAGEGEAFVRTIRQRGGAANRNPRIARVTLDGVEMPADAPARVAPRASHVLRVEFAADAREAVAEVQPDGSTRALPESLVTEFLVDGGELDGAFRSDNDLEAGAATHANTFVAPASGAVRLWVVARDGRGGFDVAKRAMAVGP